MNSEIKSITALYCRVSTDTQENGLQSQVLALKRYCKKNNISNYKVYSDFNVSGAKESRPGLNKLMDDVHSGIIDKVIVHAFSRFARSTRHLLNALEKFREYEVEFISTTENIQVNSMYGEVMFTLISALAQLERSLISSRVKAGLENARNKGRQIGRPKQRPSKVIIELHNKGYSYRKIAHLINFSHTSVAREVQEYKRKQISKGDICFQKES